MLNDSDYMLHRKKHLQRSSTRTSPLKSISSRTTIQEVSHKMIPKLPSLEIDFLNKAGKLEASGGLPTLNLNQVKERKDSNFNLSFRTA